MKYNKYISLVYIDLFIFIEIKRISVSYSFFNNDYSLYLLCGVMNRPCN